MSNSDRSLKTKSHKLLRYLAYLIITLVILLISLPFAIKFVGQYVLKDLGADQAYIKDVDLNLFTGRFALKGVQIISKNQQTVLLHELVLDISISALLKKHVLIEKLSIEDFDINIFQQDEAWVVGIPLPSSEDENEEEKLEESAIKGTEWSFGINSIAFKNINAQVNYLQEDFRLYIEELKLANLLMWEPDNRSPFIINGSINNAPLHLKSELEPFAESPTVEFDLKLNRLNLGFLSIFVGEQVQQLAASVSIDTKVKLNLENERLFVQQQGGFSLDDLQVYNEEYQLELEKLAWQGKTDVFIDQEPNIQAKLDGQLVASGLIATAQEILLSTKLNELLWHGNLSVDTTDVTSLLNLEADTKLSGWSLIDNSAEADLASFTNLSLDQLVIQGLNDIQLQYLTIENLKALTGENDDFAELKQISVQNTQLKQLNDLAIEQVFLQNLSANILQNEHAKIDKLDDWLLPFIDRIQQSYESSNDDVSIESAESSDETVAQEEQNIESQQFSYQIEKFVLQGSDAIVFTDKVVDPIVKHQLVLQNISLGKISSSNIDYLTPLDIQMKLYKHGVFKAQGEFTLLQQLEHMSGQLKAEIKGIELTDVSPYIEKNVGYQARSGQFNSNSEATVKLGHLDSKTKVRIQRIDLKPHNEEVMAKVSQSIAMPVSTAIKIITDKNNTLKLTVPVKGDLSNPDVKVNKIMSDAIAQAVKNTAMTYFKFAVQPFGAIMMVSQAIGNATLQARFEDVRFEAGSSDIVKEQQGYLAKVAEMIKEKKDFSVVACVYVTDEDFLVRAKPPKLTQNEHYQWDDESKELAEERLEYIRSSLIERHGLESNQIQGCKAQLGKGQPRAILGI